MNAYHRVHPPASRGRVSPLRVLLWLAGTGAASWAWWVHHPEPTVTDALPVWLLYAVVMAGLAAVPWTRRATP